jgi:hypothetical protein
VSLHAAKASVRNGGLAPAILKLSAIYEWFVLGPAALSVGKKGRYPLMVGWDLESVQTCRRKYRVIKSLCAPDDYITKKHAKIF